MNVPPKIGLVLSSDKSLAEALSTTLGTEDLEDLVEVILVDAHNHRLMAKKQQERRETQR